MSNSAIGAFLAFVDVEIEDCKDEKYRLKEKRARLEGLRDALMAAQTGQSPAPASFSSSSSSSGEPKSSSKKSGKKRKTDESVDSEDEAATLTKKQKAKVRVLIVSWENIVHNQKARLPRNATGVLLGILPTKQHNPFV